MGATNQPLEALDPVFIRREVKAVTFDVDGVLVPTGTFLRQSVDGTAWTMRTHALRPEMLDLLRKLRKYFWVNISSGRTLLFLQNMLQDVVGGRVSLMAENGNFCLMDGRIEQLSSYDRRYFRKIAAIRHALQQLHGEQPKRVHGFEPKHIILTVHTSEEMPEIERIVREHDREGELSCLWTLEGYDIGPLRTNKRTALQWLAMRLGIEPRQMITTGNNLNDREMLAFGIGVSMDPTRVRGAYAIPRQEGVLGGEVLARYLLRAMGE